MLDVVQEPFRRSEKGGDKVPEVMAFMYKECQLFDVKWIPLQVHPVDLRSLQISFILSSGLDISFSLLRTVAEYEAVGSRSRGGFCGR
jgi:hypothetical protein